MSVEVGQQSFFDERDGRVQGGGATTDHIVSAYVAGNADVFPRVLRLYVPAGSRVADVTYGEGVFWRNVPIGRYEVLATDIRDGVDCRALPYEEGSIDAVVLDPPYMEGFYRRDDARVAGEGTHAQFRDRYSGGRSHFEKDAPKYHEAVRAMYRDAAVEARRVLREGAVLIVKCQDEVSANRQWLTHVEIVNDCQALGYGIEDLFVVVRQNTPGVSRSMRQHHARKNHSYFLVFRRGVKR